MKSKINDVKNMLGEIEKFFSCKAMGINVKGKIL